RLLKQRVHQAFFRGAVLSSYESACCVTGLGIRECLIASHIVPWSEDATFRTDPTNGLCLSATFDRLFDAGLMTVTSDLVICFSPRILKPRDPVIRDLIRLRILTGNFSEVREICKRAKPGWVVLETANFLTQDAFNLLERVESLVRTCLLPKFFPKMFHWVEFRTVWRLRKQAYVFWDSQIFGLVPTCLIHLHDDQEFAELSGYFLKKNIHHICVGPG
ncbi:MAG: HNH endonuclease signature motif containing protein, partial [Desulfomonilaceae bacterium]